MLKEQKKELPFDLSQLGRQARCIIIVETTPARDSQLHDPSHRAKVYRTGAHNGEPMMVTGWNSDEAAVKQHAYGWAIRAGYAVDNPPHEPSTATDSQ